MGLEDTTKLQNDIADYREGSEDYFFKTYIESIQKNQKKVNDMKNTLNEDFDEDYEKAEAKLTAEIKKLRERAEGLSNDIFKCVENPCWQQHLLHIGTESPC